MLVGEFGVIEALAVQPVIMAQRSNQNGRCDCSGMVIDPSSAAHGLSEAADEPPLVFVRARASDGRAVKRPLALASPFALYCRRREGMAMRALRFDRVDGVGLP